MHRITAITQHPRYPGRYAVVLEPQASVTVSIESIERLSLRIGRELEGTEFADLEAAGQETAVYDRALAMLAARPRSARELRRRLLQKGAHESHADAAIRRLESNGLLDDQAYALQFTRSKMLAGVSRRRVQQELARRGVDRELADRAVADVSEWDRLDERSSAVAAARKRATALRSLDQPTRERRLYAYLARRGFAPDDIRAAIQDATGNTG